MFEEATTQDAGDERKSFLEARASGIGATDTPKILGLSKWGSPLSVYEEKVNPPAERQMSLPAWLGLKLQNTVGELYTEATGHRLRADNRHHRHPLHDWMVCHLDFRVLGHPEILVECKTRRSMDGYGEDGSAIIPPDVWAQVQHEMAVTGADVAHVAVLFGHFSYRTFIIQRDKEFIAALIPKLEAFWFDHVVARVPPEVSGHPADGDIVRSRHPEHDDSLIPATPEQERFIEAYGLAQYNVQQAERAKAEAANRLIDIIKDKAGIVGAAGTVTYRKPKDSTKVAWQQIAAALRGAIDEALTRRNAKAYLRSVDYDAIDSLYTDVVENARRIYYRGATDASS